MRVPGRRRTGPIRNPIHRAVRLLAGNTGTQSRRMRIYDGVRISVRGEYGIRPSCHIVRRPSRAPPRLGPAGYAESCPPLVYSSRSRVLLDAPCGVRAPPAGPGTCHPATVFPADLLSRCERSDPIALSRENLMTWYCGPGYSPVASPPSATPPARPEIAHPSAEGPDACPALLGRGVPACTDGRQYAVLHKIGTGICHPMTSGPDLCEWAAQGLVLAVPVNLTCAPQRISVTS